MSPRRAPRPDIVDHRNDPAAWASELCISPEAVALWLASEPIDLHTDTLLWWRLLGYDPGRRHRPWSPGWNSPLGNQVDFPRAWEARYAGICWDLPTNPARSPYGRVQATWRNIQKALDFFEANSDLVHFCTNLADYREARRLDRVASWLTIQGANCVGLDASVIDALPDAILRITIIHLTKSELGWPNARPGKAHVGLSQLGREVVEAMQGRRILVDLAHINPAGFWDAMEVAQPGIPVVVTHTGVNGVHRHWRNVDDDQIRAIADSGGVVGVMYQPAFLGPSLKRCPLDRVVDHLEHIIDVGGEDVPALGSDFDGWILLPDELIDITHSPKLVQLMLNRGWSERRIQKLLGENWLRVVGDLRG